MNGKFYIILVKGGEIKNWTPLSDTEYTEREANRELRCYKKVPGSIYQFRKKCVYNGLIQVLTINNHIK